MRGLRYSHHNGYVRPAGQVSILNPISTGGWKEWNCPACGKWGVSDLLLNERNQPLFSEAELIKIRHLLFENRLKRGGAIHLSEGRIPSHPAKLNFIQKAEFLSRYPATPLEYYDRALENLGRLVGPRPTGAITLSSNLWPALFCPDSQIQALGMIEELRKLEYISDVSTLTYRVSPRGWDRITHLQRPGRDSRQAFVAMWFDQSMDDFYENGFRPAIEEDGKTKALRIDGKDHNNKIDDEIIAEIRRSRFVVADFTGHRGGVYFEAGFALGLGLPVIWTCHENQIEAAHFDTRQYNHITYSSAAELRNKLRNRISATVA